LDCSFGVVDGIVDGQLCGWLMNRDGRSVICHGSQGRQMPFAPFIYREDVVLTYQSEGVWGFAIPIELLAPLGPVVRVTDEAGVALTNGEAIRLPLASFQNVVRPPLRIFLHIPKTAGTSLRNTLLGNVPPGECLLIYPGPMPGVTLERAHEIPLRHRDQLSWVYGHLKFGFDRSVTRPCRYFTFVREPLDRLRSNFAHHAAAGTLFQIDGRPVRPSVVFNQGLAEEFDNVMTRVLSGYGVEIVPLGRVGEDEVELAIRNVREHFEFVGMYAQAERDVVRLQISLGLPRDPLRYDNVTPPINHYDQSEMVNINWDQVAARNWADVMLYRRLISEGLVSRILG
jgi:hypothetical protein